MAEPGSPFASPEPAARGRFFGGKRLFHDRREAGRKLAAALTHLKSQHPLVLALPRGGAPVAFEVAELLDAEMDVVLVRKLAAPGHPELGLGAVVDGSAPQVVLNEAVVAQVRPQPGYIEAEISRQLVEIQRRRLLYRGQHPASDPHGRTVILVDDGVATGGGVRAALKAVRHARPRRIVLAVPVAPRDTIAALRGLADEIICLATPEPFHAVGLFYEDFTQTEDAEVVALLARRRRLEGPAAGH
ncbi:MAG TPA: phosphoribosyltransferase [Caulobacteraceae bacterium]|nr:phosphoribosyltransferase [Caulobacteraceae bacterium]